MRSRYAVVLAAVILIAAFVPAVFAEEIQHPQIVKMNEAEWENFQYYFVSGGEVDNAVAFYDNAPDSIMTNPGNTIYPLQLEVYSDLTRATVDWNFYVNGSLANQCAVNPMPMICCITDSNGSWVTYNFYFEYLGPGLAKATAFELPLAYILSNGCNQLNLQIYLSNTINENCSGQFFIVPNTTRMRPNTTNIWPADTLWGSVAACVVSQVVQSELQVSCVNSPGVQTAVNGAENQVLCEYAFTALNSDITIPSSVFYGYIQGSFGSDSLYVCRDFVDPPGTYVYINNMFYNVRIYDCTTDPTMINNLNSTAESFASTTGAAVFGNMNWTIPAGETHLLRIVGNVCNTAYQNGVVGNKWLKVDILDPNNIWAYDESGNRVFITDNNGEVWEPQIDGNGDSQPFPVNNTAHLIQINDTGELYITLGDGLSATNVIAGMSNVPMLNLMAQAINEAFNINKLRIYQIDAIYNRSVISVTISYQNQADSTITNTVSMVNGIADFNITAMPWFIPSGWSRNADVYFNLAPINQTNGAYTGDKVRAEFIATVNFEAKGVGGSNTELHQTSNGDDVYGNQMVVHGNVPIITVDQYTNTNLINGQVELYRWQVTAAEGGTNIYSGQHSLRMLMIDSVPTSASLALSNFQVYEGLSYSAVAPLVQATSGTNAYEVYRQTGDVLSGSPYILYASSTGDTAQSIVITYYDDRVIPAGITRYYILKAVAFNVNTGINSNDAISCYMHDGDIDYAPPLAADFNPEDPFWSFTPGFDVYLGAVLDDDLSTLLGNEFMSWMIWSDGTGTNGDYNHQQSSYNGGPSSLDWVNGYLIKNLSMSRTLTATFDDRGVNGGEVGEVIVPTEFITSNFPNPFNPTTAISFALPEAGNVSLIVYDIIGREVVRLVDSYYSAGEYTVQFNGSALSSGIYFYHIVAGDYIATQKMMLVK